MMRKFATTTLVILFSIALLAQPTLKPSIGIGQLPNDADSICDIGVYTGSYYTTGLDAGDTAANFTLYSVNGDSLNLEGALSNGKPVLLVNGSYTCPVFRNKLSIINDVAQTYSGQLDVYIIYTVEAHPIVDESPYSGTVWTTQSNYDDGVLYEQPKTYGEKKAIVTDLISDLNPVPEIYIDGPCNNWWEYYGPAPQNSYLIDTTGIVFSKHGWFDKLPDDIYCDIDSLLFDSPCASLDLNGTFFWQLTSNDTVWGEPGAILTSKGNLINNSNADAQIQIIRLQENVPSGWQTSMCIDYCLDPETDTAEFILQQGDTQSYTMYFYTDLIENTGHARMGFRNMNNGNNQFMQNFWGITADSLIGIDQISLAERVTIYPNPVNEILTIKGMKNYSNTTIKLFDLQGRNVINKALNVSELNIQQLNAGTYLYKIESGGELLGQGKIQKL